MGTEVNMQKVRFTETELKVLKKMSAGLSAKEIAAELNMEVTTARKHLENIRRKTGLTKNTEILGYYISELTGKPFSLSKLREYGIAVFLIFINVCRLDV